MSIGQWMGEKEAVPIHNWIVFSHDKGWKFEICDNMDRSGGYYAKWNKSDRESQVHDLTYNVESKNENKNLESS